MLLRKQRIPAEVYNDLDGRVVEVFRVLRDPVKAEAVRQRLSLTPFARAEFDSCYAADGDDEIEAACKTIMLSFMGYGTDSITRGTKTGFRCKMSDDRATPAAPWGTYHEAVAAFTERLRGVVIECRDASEVILRMDTPGTLFFVDPPYVASTRSSVQGRQQNTHGYKHEMDDADHRALAETLHGLQGMVMLCGYPSALYDGLYSGWNRLEREALADGAKKRTEVLWFNPAAWNARPQMELMERDAYVPRRLGM